MARPPAEWQMQLILIHVSYTQGHTLVKSLLHQNTWEPNKQCLHKSRNLNLLEPNVPWSPTRLLVLAKSTNHGGEQSPLFVAKIHQGLKEHLSETLPFYQTSSQTICSFHRSLICDLMGRECLEWNASIWILTFSSTYRCFGGMTAMLCSMLQW